MFVINSFEMMISSFLQLCFVLLLSPATSFMPRNDDVQSAARNLIPRSTMQKRLSYPLQNTQKATTKVILRQTNELNGNDNPTKTTTCKIGYTLSLLASVASWANIAYTALSMNPTPAVQAVTSIRHNCFTIAQALGFPIPVLVASFMELKHLPLTSPSFRRLNLGIAVASLWSAAAVIWGETFSVGYDLFSKQPLTFRAGLPLVQAIVALFALWKWKDSVQAVVTSGNSFTKYCSRLVDGCIESLYSLLSPTNVKAQCYALATKGLFVLAALPQLVSFPTATIPTLLGKRLSRAASGYTWLGAVALLCLYQQQQQQQDSSAQQHKYLEWGLGLGSLLHISLVWAKIIGFDGGGLLLPGRGLWQDYPSLIKASLGATSLMMITYPLVVYATMKK